MRNQIVPGSIVEAPAQDMSLLEKTFFFHDIAVQCRTNAPRILVWLEEMYDAFPQPTSIRGEVQYNVFCYAEARRFPVQLPPERRRTDAIQLLTGSILKYYRSPDAALDYHSYAALAGVNGRALTVIERDAPVVTTQLEPLERYRPSFLQRYVFLLALGHVMTRFGFEPFHAAAVTAPWDDGQGALLVGASGSGKTTLGVGCAIAGCGLLGDDLVMLRAQEQDNSIRACAVTHEVAVRSSTLHLWEALAFLEATPADERDKRYCSINDIRAGSARLQAPVRRLLFPALTGEARSRVIPMSKAQTLSALIEQSMSSSYQHHSAPDALFALLSQLAQQAAGYRVLIARGSPAGPALVTSLFAGE